MSSYYSLVTGHLAPGEIAKSEDINDIQSNIQDCVKNAISDMYNKESFVLEVGDEYKDAFVLKAAPKTEGRYVDCYYTFEETNKTLNFNSYTIRQPILLTKTSLYSIRTRLKNTSNRTITATCELWEENALEPMKTNTIAVTPTTESGEFFEIVFDVDFIPTAIGEDFKKLIQTDGKNVAADTSEESFDEGYLETDEDKSVLSDTSGVTKVYFVIKQTDLSESSFETENGTAPTFNAETSLGVFVKDGSYFPDKDIYVEIGNPNTGYSRQESNIYHQEIYANEKTYVCSGGSAIIDGERVDCIDSHISVEGGSDFGNTLTQIYMDSDGHLQSATYKASYATDIDDFEEDKNNPLPHSFYLPIALILVYSNELYGTGKEPLLLQGIEYGQLPPNHHERLRRVEKRIKWDEDIALPGRIKRTITDGDWIDTSSEHIKDLPNTTTESTEEGETPKTESIFTTTDEKGNVVVKLSNALTHELSVTLKEKLKDSDGKEKTLKETDVLNISSFSTIENMVHDSTKGTLILDKEKVTNEEGMAFTEAEAKETEYNPWDDAKENRASNKDVETHEREYKVVKGKNGASDSDSSYPGMTFYTSTNLKFKKLTIPIFKFKDCSSVKFYIWKRQDKNNKKNKVPNFKKKKQLIWSGKPFSLKKAKTKGKYQYVEEGFTIEFGKGGLSLSKGQYVIIAVPVPKSKTGSMFVKTYKPKNSKDFCIKYVGAANASHFKYKEAYQEVWYNPSTAIVTKENYYTEGKVISKTLNWTESGLEPIKSVKPIVGKNLTIENSSNCSYELYVNTGGDWIKVTPGEDNPINNGGTRTFKWKLVFKGDGKNSPELKYNSDDKYAIKFIITRGVAGDVSNLPQVDAEDKSMCLTSTVFDGDKILREYIGDVNFGLTNSRFEGYEFARIWANNDTNQKLLIDIQASDKSMTYPEKTNSVDLWSLHYCDLTLDDFTQEDVDYSDYNGSVEYDENNMRLKLDSNHSYNDNDIQFIPSESFVKDTNEVDNNESKTDVTLESSDAKTNQRLLRKTFENPVDLSNYTGLKFKFNLSLPEDDKSAGQIEFSGLGIYLSTEEMEDEVPSDVKYLPENFFGVLNSKTNLPPIITPGTKVYEMYNGKVIAIENPIKKGKDGNNISRTGYFRYLQEYDESEGDYVYKLTQVYDLKPYNIYRFGKIICDPDTKEVEGRIQLDKDSNNSKYVKEIGVILLNDEEEYSLTETSVRTKILASCTTNGTITLQLVNNDDTPLGGKQLYEGRNLLPLTNSDDGKTSKLVTGASDDKGMKFEFLGDKIVDGEGKTIVYSASEVYVVYDFAINGLNENEDEINLNVDVEDSLARDTENADNNIEKITKITKIEENDAHTDIVITLSEMNSSGEIVGPVKDQTISLKNSNGTETTSGTTDASGQIKIEISSLKGKGTMDVVYNGESKKDGDKYNIYKPCGAQFKYDVRKPEDRITSKGLVSCHPSKLNLSVKSVKAIREDTLKIYDPEDKNPNLRVVAGENVEVHHSGSISVDGLSETDTDPITTQIKIKHKNNSMNLKTLCYFNNPFQGGLSDYKHIGIQLATDVYIPKDCLKLNICSGYNGENVVESVNLPTMNSIYYPTTSGEKINLSQVFKKIKNLAEDTEIKSISISATSHFDTTINRVVKDSLPAINLFIGKIVLYRAESIPIYHNKLRFKFYSTTNGQIDHYGTNRPNDSISIRKIGTILDYH